MPWLLTSPGHQQQWHWLCNICRSWSYLRKEFKYLCHINVEKWVNDTKCKYLFMFPMKNLACNMCKGLRISFENQFRSLVYHFDPLIGLDDRNMTSIITYPIIWIILTFYLQLNFEQNTWENMYIVIQWNDDLSAIYMYTCKSQRKSEIQVNDIYIYVPQFPISAKYVNMKNCLHVPWSKMIDYPFSCSTINRQKLWLTTDPSFSRIIITLSVLLGAIFNSGSF